MSRNLRSLGLYDESVIDDRNVRPLTIAFATIVLVWLLAFGLVFLSGARSHHRTESAAPVAASIDK